MKEKTLNNELLERFKNHLRAEEKSKNTIEKYIRDVKALMQYVDGEQIDKEKTISYKDYLIKKDYNAKSINSIIASINSYLNFINRVDCRLKALKIQRQIFCSKEKELTKLEYVRLINAAKLIGNKRISLIIQTICCTGIRVSELEFITVEAVKRGEVTVFLKGKTRKIFIIRELQRKLLNYISEQKIMTGSVFVTRTGKPIGRTNIWREMKGLCKRAGVDSRKVFPHNLRHLFARTFYGIEKDIVKLADILGHSSVNTTRIYIITTGEEHRKRMENMHLII